MYSRMNLGSLLLLAGATCLAQGVIRGTPPKITSPSNAWPRSTVYVRTGGTNPFTCRANGEPAPTYKWTFNGTDIYQIPNLVTFDEVSGVLTIGMHFSEAFNGDYQCIAMNENGKAMTPFLRILKAEINAFTGNTSDPRYLTKNERDYLELPCENPPKSAPPLKYFWRRKYNVGKDPIQEEISPNDPRLKVDPHGTLHFLWLETEDSKYKYYCGGNNQISGLDAISMVTYQITVIETPFATRAPLVKYSKDVVAVVGETVELVCIFTYFPLETEEFKIEWSLKGNKLGEGERLVIPSVQLPSDTQNQEGQYLCQASLGNNIERGTVNLKIVASPQFVHGMELKGVSAALGNTAEFHCGTVSHNSYARPIVWMVNSEPIIGCPIFNFECERKGADGRPECIPEKERCNGVPNCLDRSDEENCDIVGCNEGQKACNGVCVDQGVACTEKVCDYPNFRCTKGGDCIEGGDRCTSCPDQQGCPGRENITVGRFVVSSDRSKLLLPDVMLSDSFCFQCMATNDYGTLVGDGCLTVIDKIDIILPPDDVYTITPDMTLTIIVDAVTDAQWQKQMKFEWFWYDMVIDPDTNQKKTVPVELPPPSFEEVFVVSANDKQLTITVPELDPEDENTYDVYDAIKDRQYAVKISHQYDTVYGRFSIEGEPASRPTVAPVVQEPLWPKLWFLVLIFGIIILFIVVALIVCYLYRNRGGTYPLDRKEIKAGHDPEKELAMDGFTDAGRLGADVKEYDDMLKEDGPPY